MSRVIFFLRRGLLLLSAGCLTLVILVAAMIMTILAQRHGTELTEQPDCILVFGSAVYGWNTPGPAMLRRVSTAVRLYHENPGSMRFIFTGGKTNRTDQSEATVMRQYAVRQNIPASLISLEEQAQSTWENLLYSKPLLEGCNHVLGISDGYHLARIRLAAWLLGWGSLQTLPADEEPERHMFLRSVLREMFAMTYYVIDMPWLDSVPTIEQ